MAPFKVFKVSKKKSKDTKKKDAKDKDTTNKDAKPTNEKNKPKDNFADQAKEATYFGVKTAFNRFWNPPEADEGSLRSVIIQQREMQKDNIRRESKHGSRKAKSQKARVRGTVRAEKKGRKAEDLYVAFPCLPFSIRGWTLRTVI